MINKSNWNDTKRKWDAYWRRCNAGRPLMCVIAQKEEPAEKDTRPLSMEEQYLDAGHIVRRFRSWAGRHEFLAESFPNLSLDFGPGSMAGYLGCNIIFKPDTVWFEELVTEENGWPDGWIGYPDLAFDPDNAWFKRHIALFEEAKCLAGDDFLLGIPDIMENADVLASMRGAQNTIFDMMDEPEEFERRIRQVQDAYYKYYDRFYHIVKGPDGGSCYTVFQIYGTGRTVKLQCDFSAMMGPDQFSRYIVPALDGQARQADHVLYHLDGPDAIRHVPALMEIDGIDALQWTSGDHGPDGTMDTWYPIYDQAIKAGKGLWVKVYTGAVDEWMDRLDHLVARYGSNALFLYFSPMSRENADRLLNHAEKNWRDVEGSVK